jgi:glycosyltransferase involved in cell wall biosynthesis
MADAKRPLISVAMLCYNHERFVAEALDGVLAQTYRPIEIVIVDDGSLDVTADIVAAKLATLPDCSNIRFIRNPHNAGLLGACEVAVKTTNGRFIVLTCDDDVMLPDMVAEMVEVWRREDVSLVTANAELIDEHSKSRGEFFRDPQAQADDSFETLVRDGANACCFGAGIGFEREIYTTFGLPPRHLDNLDILLPFYAYLLKGARFVHKPLLKYRIHGQNNALSRKADQLNGIDRLVVRDHIYYGHIAHAVAMQEQLDALSVSMPSRYAELAPKIAPLLTMQTVEMAKKLVRNRIQLQALREAPASL